MPVDTKYPDWIKWTKKWSLVQDIIDNDAKKYIRQVDQNDWQRSAQYRDDAILTNFVALTKTGLIGLVFRKEPEVFLPSDLEYMYEDVTGDGLSLNQFSAKALSEVLTKGRFGVLVDFPKVDEMRSKADTDGSADKARFKTYYAESIINHKTKFVGNKVVLSLVVLHEQIEDPLNQDKFETPLVDRYRVLELDDNGFYCQTVYDQNGIVTEATNWPSMGNGRLFNYIPFLFFGSETNDGCFDPVPLYDLACISLGHYRNSADYEESIFVCGQPMGVWSISGSAAEFEAANPGGILWGSRRGVNVGENGSGTLLQANPNQLADTAMARKEAQAAAIGARLIAPGHTGRETAESARIRYGAQNSVLHTITTNISLGVITLMSWACDYMQADFSKVKFCLSTNFYDDSTDPQMLMAMMQGYDRGFILAQEVRAYMRETGAQAYLDNSDARALTNIHLQSPLDGLDADITNDTAIANAKKLATVAPKTAGGGFGGVKDTEE